ncbi:MAG: DUF4367 domain-containing protein [Clostridia bacterium]|nr:DUF4367 domain-containing protein [Clostridia bacterium]
MTITTKEQLRSAFDEAIMSCYRRDVRASLFERTRPSPEHTARMHAILGITAASPAPSPRLRRLTPRRILLIVLILILTAALVGCAYYIGTQLSTRETDEYLEVNGLLNIPEDTELPTSVENFYLPTYIPEGYEKRVLADDIYGVYIFFESEEGKIAFTQDPVGSVIRMDNEHGDLTHIERNGVEYIRQASSNVIYFCWTDGEYIFGVYITPNFSDDDAFKIIDSIKPVEN